MKRLWQIVVSLSVIVTLCATSFFLPVKAADATINDLYNLLYSIDQALSAPSSNRSTDLIYRFTELKQDFEWLFGKYGDGQGDGHINYMLNNQSVTGSTMSIAIGDLITQQNEILMSLVSSYVDASDPDNIVIKPGLLDRVNAIASAVSSSASSDASIASDIDSLLSEFTTLKNAYENSNIYDIPTESLIAYTFFMRFNQSSIRVDHSLKYPLIDLKESVSGEYNSARRLYVPAGKTCVISFLLYSNDGLSTSNFTPYVLNHTVDDTLSIQYKFLPVGNVRRLYHIIVKNIVDYTVSVSFDFSFDTKTVVPLYVGLENLMSSEMRSAIMYFENESEYDLITDIRDLLVDPVENVSWLQKIYNHIVGDPDSNNQTQQDIDSMNDKVSDIQDSLDNYSDRLDQNIDQVDPSSLWSDINSNKQGVNFLSGVVHSVYSSFGSYSWLFLLPLILGLIILFMG